MVFFDVGEGIGEIEAFEECSVSIISDSSDGVTCGSSSRMENLFSLMGDDIRGVLRLSFLDSFLGEPCRFEFGATIQLFMVV